MTMEAQTETETGPRERRGGPARLAPKRECKLQILLSAQERARLDELAQASGFESAASYVRARTLTAPTVPCAIS